MTSTILCPRCSKLPRATVNCSKCKVWQQRAEDAAKRQPELPKMKELEFHEYANIFPLMDDAELAALAEDIDANGLREPIWLCDGKIADGRNRWLACKLKDVDPRFEEYRGKDLLGFVLSKNLHRRHLSTSQRAMIAAELLNLRPTDANLRPTVDQTAKALNVSPRSVDNATKVLDQAAPKLVDAVKKGEVTVGAASTLADALPKKEQAAAVKSGTVPEVAKKIRAKRKPKVPSNPQQPALPKMAKKPHAVPTKKGRPTEPGMLADLETVERCVKELKLIQAALNFLARHDNGVSEIAKNVFATDDPDGDFILHERKLPDPANHNMITPFMTCAALEGFMVRMFLIGHEIIRLHGVDVDQGETITF